MTMFKINEFDNEWKLIDTWEHESNDKEGNYHPTLGQLLYSLARRSAIYEVWYGDKLVATTAGEDDSAKYD